MNIRDLEIKNLVHYAKGLGIVVTFKQAKKKDPAAAWIEGGKEIIIYTYPNLTKTQTILNLLHELCHHHDWIERNRTDSTALLNALIKDDENLKKLNKKERKLIFEDEKRATGYREYLVKTIGITLPYYKVKADIEYDIWDYGYFYKTGLYPKTKDRRLKKKELEKKYKEKYGSATCLEVIK